MLHKTKIYLSCANLTISDPNANF